MKSYHLSIHREQLPKKGVARSHLHRNGHPPYPLCHIHQHIAWTTSIYQHIISLPSLNSHSLAVMTFLNLFSTLLVPVYQFNYNKLYYIHSLQLSLSISLAFKQDTCFTTVSSKNSSPWLAIHTIMSIPTMKEQDITRSSLSSREQSTWTTYWQWA